MMHHLRRNPSAISVRSFWKLLEPSSPSRTFCSHPSDYRSLLQKNESNELADSTVDHPLEKPGEFADNVDDGLSLSDVLKSPPSNVGIFWDLENKPPSSVSPYEAAIKLRKSVAPFGIITYMVACGNHHAFSYVPHAVNELRNEREVLNHLENKGFIKRIEPYGCKVCGRKFKTNGKLMMHFKIHQREHQKRLNQINSAKGKMKVGLVDKYAARMEKYRNASRDVLIPNVGYGLADELKLAGFSVKTVSGKSQDADVALRNHMMDLMDRGKVQFLVLVSDDSDFLGVLKAARERCVKTVVVGDHSNGVLMRNADGFFSWGDIIVGKAKTQAISVMRRYRDFSKRLELTDDPAEVEKGADKLNDSCVFEDHQDKDVECGDSNGDDDKSWWELD